MSDGPALIDDTGAMIAWFSPAEYAAFALPKVPTNRNSLAKKLKKLSEDRPDMARKRESAGRGGGLEYHHNLLPTVARQELRHRAAVARVAAGVGDGMERKEAVRDARWRAFDALPDRQKQIAGFRVAVLDDVRALREDGWTMHGAVGEASWRWQLKGHKASKATIYNWIKAVKGVRRDDWLCHLAPQYQGGQITAACDEIAYEAFKADYLRQERPGAQPCYERLLAAAAARDWRVPSLKSLLRRIDREIPAQAIIYLREGPEALRETYPAQERDRSVFEAMEAVNADGHKADVWVTFPDGEVCRPSLIVVQDLYSGKILSWRVDKTETATAVRLAFRDVFQVFGIPVYAYLDNGRAFAAKIMTGGQDTRYRHKVTPGEMEGVLTALGVKVHWTTPYSGQSKPIERAFRDFCAHIATHPDLAGAYAGNRPDNKPDYKVKPVSLETFLATVEQGFALHNAREGRRSKVCNGRSLDQAFNASLETAMVRRASEGQLRLALLSAEQVTAPKKTGEVHLLGNRYWSEFLVGHIGEKLTLRFDPEELHKPILVYRADGVLLGEADCQEPAGFNSIDDARVHNTKRNRYVKAAKTIAAMEKSMSIERWAAMLPGVSEPPPPETKLVRMMPNTGAAVAAANEEALPAFDYEAADRGLRLVPMPDD